MKTPYNSIHLPKPQILRNFILILSISLLSNLLFANCPNNILSNPGFEDDFTGWDASGGAAIAISNDAFEGNNALHIDCPDDYTLTTSKPQGLTFSFPNG